MPEPDDFQHRKFPTDSIIFNHNTFSVAWGTWEGNERRLGMRWNGVGTDPGYPKLFGRPVWFMVPVELTVPILKGLLEAEHSNKEAIHRVMAEADGAV